MSDKLDKALDLLEGPGVIEFDEPGGRTRVDVVEADGLGVRVSGVHVGHGRRDMREMAKILPDAVRALPGRLMPVEVAPVLGGATLRTRPEDMRKGRFFEVEVRREGTNIKRYRVHEGRREPEDFTLTREQLRDLVDEVRGPVEQ